MCAAAAVVDEDLGELAWDRDGAGGLVGLGRCDLAVAVDLVGELDLGVVERVESDVRPGQAEELREAGAGERGDREQRLVRLSRGGERLLELGALEYSAAFALGWLRSLRREHQRHRVSADPAEPAGGVAVDAVGDADDDRDGGLGRARRAEVADELGEVVGGDRRRGGGAERGRRWLSTALR